MSQDVQDAIDQWLRKEAADGAGPQDASSARAMANRMVQELGEFGITPDQIESAVGGDLGDYIQDYMGPADSDDEGDAEVDNDIGERDAAAASASVDAPTTTPAGFPKVVKA